MIDDPVVLAIRQRAGLTSPADAEKALSATLATLFERIPLELRDLLLSTLPPSLTLTVGNAPLSVPSKPFSFDDFCQRLADREGADVPVAVFHARTVLQELRENPATAEVLERISTHLTNDFAPLFWHGSTAATAA